MTNERFDALFGGPPARPESKLTQKEMDLAASVQVVTRGGDAAPGRGVPHALTGMRQPLPGRRRRPQLRGERQDSAGGPLQEHLDSAGGGRRRRRAGRGAVGLAPDAGQPAHDQRARTRMKGSLLGPEYTRCGDRAATWTAWARSARSSSDAELVDRVARLLAEEKILGWFRGRMEFGPRALGARSIIGDARSPRMQAQMNLKIKFRESFRPFAPCVLHEHVSEYFELDCESPYMLLVAPVAEDKRTPMTGRSRSTLWGIDKLERPAQCRFPPSRTWTTARACRPSTRSAHGMFHCMMQRFYELTGLSGRSSTPASTSAASRSCARPRTRTGASCSPTSTRSYSATGCC